ncbi:MAG: cytosine permease [Oscillospiraceae bacterium]
MEEKKSTTMESKAMSRVGDSERQSWLSIAFIWIGTMICIPMLMVGGLFSTSMTFGSIILAAALGFGICCLIMTLTGIQGTDLGLPCYMCATKGFGDRGSSYLMSVIIFVGQLGWFGIQTTACATAFCKLLGSWNVSMPLWLSCIIWGAVMLVTAVYGFKMMKILNYIAVPALVLMCGYGAIHAVGMVGMDAITSYVPETAMPLGAAVSTCMGLFAIGTVINSDYSRYAKCRADTVKASVLGVLPAAILMILIGAIMAFAAGDYDITNVFASMGLPILSMLVLILATWTTNTGNAYTVGLAAMKITGLPDKKRPLITLGCGIIGILLAMTGLANALESWIGIISSIVPAVAGVMIADYWFVGKGKPENWHPVKGFNWIGILAWAAGSVVALFFSFFSQALDSILVSLVAYLLLYAAFGKTALAGKGAMTVEEAEKSVQA